VSTAPRTGWQRRQDTEQRLAHDVDLWVASCSADRADRFAVRSGFDPRSLTTTYLWFRISPSRIQAWREVDELAGRQLMMGGRWLV